MNIRRWILLAAIVLIVAALFWVYRSRGVSASSEEKDLLDVKRVDYPLSVSASGILEAAKSKSIGPPAIPSVRNFKLTRLVEEGTQVSEGDFLMEFDGSDISKNMRDDTTNFQRVQEEYQKKRSDFDNQMRDLKLSVEQAKSDYEKLVNMLNRQAELESAMTIEETKLKRDTAKRKVEFLEKKVKYLTESGRLDMLISLSSEKKYKQHMDEMLDAMDSLTVTAPVSGVVIYRRDWQGEARQVGSSIDRSGVVMELPDLSTLRTKILVDEVDVGKVKVGQDVQVTVDALKGKVFKGKIAYLSAILKQASWDRPQKIAEAWVEFTKDMDLTGLRPGMGARSSVQVGQYPQAIVVPMSSIVERQGRSYVQVWHLDNKTYEMREIRLLMNDDLYAIVGNGLQVNEKIRSKAKV